jgi:hypothetical protein
MCSTTASCVVAERFIGARQEAEGRFTRELAILRGDELARSSEPMEENGEGDCEGEVCRVCWNSFFRTSLIFFTDGKQVKETVGVALRVFSFHH